METKNNKEGRIYKINSNLVSFLEQKEKISTKKAVKKVEIQFYYDDEVEQKQEKTNFIKNFLEKFLTTKKSDYDNKYNWLEVQE